MRVQTINRQLTVRAYAFGGTSPRQVRVPLRQSSSSSSTPKRGTKDVQQLLQFVQEWAPVLQAEHTKMQQAADRLASIEQVLASEDHPIPVLAGPGLKLTAANTCSRWLPAHSSSSSSSPDSWSSPLGAQPRTALQYNTAVQYSSSCTDEDANAAAVHVMLQDIRATEQEVSALLESCMQEMNSMLGGKALLNTTAVSNKHSSNIVPWAPTAAAAIAPTAAAAAAAAATMPSASLPAAVIAATDAALPAPVAAAAVERPAGPAEQLVVVYLNSSSSSNASPADTFSPAAAAAAEAGEQASPAVVGEVLPPCVCYLRLPQQQQEYEAAVKQGLRVVPLKGLTRSTGSVSSSGSYSSSASSSNDGSSSSSSSSCLCIEELAWMNQQQGCWGHEAAPLEFFHAQELMEETSLEVATAPVPEPPAPAVVKVEVGVQLRTKPGQRVLLVGNHPTLGSWDLSKAWKLKWSDGHVWRGCLELPADIPKIEFKAVLKSADAAIWERGSNKQVQLQGTDSVAMQYAFQA